MNPFKENENFEFYLVNAETGEKINLSEIPVILDFTEEPEEQKEPTQKEIQEMAIDLYGEEMQHVVAMEELAELTKEISKYLRGYDNREKIIEEMADVYICLDQLHIMHEVTEKEIDEMMDRKFERNYLRMKKEIDEMMKGEE